MKILMVGNNFSVKGGITTVIQSLLKNDWEKYGICMRFIPTYIDDNFGKMILFFLQAYAKIRNNLRHEHPDIVHIHMSYKGSFFRAYAIQRLCKKYMVPTIIHLHGSEFEKWYESCNTKTKRLVRSFMRESAAFIVLGSAWEKVVHQIEPKANTVVINNAVEEQKASSHWAQPFKILFMGVLIERKGILDLMSAIRELKEEQKISLFRFVIAGTGPLESELKSFVYEHDLEDFVDFCGWADEEKKKELYSKCQVLVLPSYNEGLPMAILEAMSFGMPIIATNVGDVTSAVHNGENGFVVEPHNIEQMKQCFLLLANDYSLCKIMQMNSKKIIHASFTDTVAIKKIYSTYSEVYNRQNAKN